MLHRIGVLALLAGVAVCDEPEVELDVPFEPTHPDVVRAMLKLAAVTAEDTVYDLGCGDGRIVVTAAKEYGARGVGVDIDPARIKDAEENAAASGVAGLVEFRKGDLKGVDISPATVVTLYLLNSVNLEIRPKLFRELRPGTRVVSHAFHMDDWKCDKDLEHPLARHEIVYYWVIPVAAGGTWNWTDKGSGEGEGQLRLEQDFQKLRGTFSSAKLKGKGRVVGSVEGVRITATATVREEDGPVDVVFDGTLSGDAVEGTQTWKTGEKTVRLPWAAARRPVELAGRWQLTAKDPKEGIDGTLVLTRKDGALNARYIGNGKRSAADASALYLWGSSVRFEVPWEGGEGVTFEGFFDGNAARGTAYGDPLSKRQAWTAKRVGER